MATLQKQFHRTVIEVEVLSEEPYTPESLAAVAHDITAGECSGAWEIKAATVVDAATMAKLLLSQGSDPSFFRLDDTGGAVDDDWL